MATNNPPPPARPLRRSRPLLVGTALLFAAWIGWLAYLAVTTTRPIVLSRPQFLSSQVDVIGEIGELGGRPDPAVVVERVRWMREPGLAPQEQQQITVSNLVQVGTKEGWSGPGTYILPLVKENGTYALAPLGASPGSPGRAAPHIYRVTPDTLAQLDQIRGPR